MTNDEKLMQQALEALESDNPDIQLRASIAIRARLAQPKYTTTSDTPEWRLISPEGRVYRGDSPLRCLRAEQDERIPPEVQIDNIRAAMEEAKAEPSAEAVEPFIIKHYCEEDRPIIKGNGFDGLEIGEDREDAENFVSWINARLFAVYGKTQQAEQAEPKYMTTSDSRAMVSVHQRYVSVDTLSKLCQNTTNVDRNQPGFHWRNGWNDALRMAMDYGRPQPEQAEPVAGEELPTDEMLLDLAANLIAGYLAEIPKNQQPYFADDAAGCVREINNRLTSSNVMSGDRLIPINVNGCTHTRTAAEWCALARSDLRAQQQPEQAEPVAWPHQLGCRANAFGACNMGCTAPPTVAAALGRAASEIQALIDGHKKNTAECDTQCDFVDAWEHAIHKIRALIGKEPK